MQAKISQSMPTNI